MEAVLTRARRLAPLRSLTDTLLLSLLTASEQVPDRVQQGVVLFRAGEACSCWYLLLTGQVQLYLTHEDGSLHPVCTLSAGAIFGEIDFQAHNCAARVVKPAEFVRIPQLHFLNLYRKYADQLSSSIFVTQDMLSDQTLYEPGPSQRPYDEYRAPGLNVQQQPHQQPQQQRVYNVTQVPYSNGGMSQEGYAERQFPHNAIENPRVVRNGNIRNRKTEEMNGFSVQRPRQFPHDSAGERQYVQERRERRDDLDPYNMTGLRRETDLLIGGYESSYDNVPYEDPYANHTAGPAGPHTTSNGVRNQSMIIDQSPRLPHAIDGESSVIELCNQVSLEARLVEVSCTLRHAMRMQRPHMICDHSFRGKVFSNCMSGSDMVDWLLELALSAGTNMSQMSRFQVSGMWQILLEHNVITHVTGEHPFSDKLTYYRWNVEDWQRALMELPPEEGEEPGTPVPGQNPDFSHFSPNNTTSSINTEELISCVLFLSTVGPDALFRMILGKPPQDRSPEELELVYNELLHVKALTHLSTMVKRELASVIGLETHTHAGTVLYHQGDRGKCWYIVLKGAVEVSIRGKGVVCTLREGDDFGKLALVNDSPRSATVTLVEEESHFLIVDKYEFNRVLLDVEANTVRLKEHGHDVLVLERMSIPSGAAIQTNERGMHCCYSVMAGMAEKMVEYALETRIGVDDAADTFLEDFLLTHSIYMPSNVLCNFLRQYYVSQTLSPEDFSMGSIEWELESVGIVQSKGRVVKFLAYWVETLGIHYFLDPAANGFIEELYCLALEDCRMFPAMDEVLTQLAQIRITREAAMRVLARRPCVVLECGVYSSQSPAPTPVLPSDTCNQIMHLSDTTSFAMSIRMDRSAADICRMARSRMRNAAPPAERMVLVEVKSSGERVVFSPSDVSVPTMLGLNSRLYVVAKEEIHTLSASPEQSGPQESVHSSVMEYLSSSELAQQLFVMHTEMFEATDETELITQVFGRDQFPGRVPSNLDILLRRFNEVQYWATTEVLLAVPNRRVQILRKFIKIAMFAKENRDLLSLFAITLGLSNVAVSRLYMLWNRLPAKMRRQFSEFEALLDPSRNHRAYRALLASLHPPMVPFVPLLLKDLTFIHEGNKTYFNGLVNEEKMHMVACVLRNFRKCKANFPAQIYEERKIGDTQNLIRNFRVIDNQRRLMELSYQIEPRRRRIGGY